MASSPELGQSRAVFWTCGAALIIAGLCLIPLGHVLLVRIRLTNLRPDDVQSIQYAAGYLTSNDVPVRRMAGRELAQIASESEQAESALLAALRDKSYEVARDAAHALSQIKSPSKVVLEGLTAALDHEDGEVRRYAAYALSRYGGRGRLAIPQLTKRLGDEHMAYMAARALGGMGSEARGAIGPMTALLSSSSLGDRAEAALALSKLTPLPQATVAAIEALANDQEEGVRDSAKKALQNIRASNAR